MKDSDKLSLLFVYVAQILILEWSYKNSVIGNGDLKGWVFMVSFFYCAWALLELGLPEADGAPSKTRYANPVYWLFILLFYLARHIGRLADKYLTD